MSEQPPGEVSALTFQEIRIDERERAYKYSSPSSFSYAVLIFGGLNCIFGLLNIMTLINQQQLLIRMNDHLFESQKAMTMAATENDQIVKLVSVVFLTTLILTYVSSAVWLYRVACNVRAIGARRLENTPGWAVGWYFVPFMSLFKPFGAMVEIWNGSHSPDLWKIRPVPSLLRWWWGLWLGVGIFGYIQSALWRADKTIPSLIFATQSGMADMALNVVATVLFRKRGASPTLPGMIGG